MGSKPQTQGYRASHATRTTAESACHRTKIVCLHKLNPHVTTYYGSICRWPSSFVTRESWCQDRSLVMELDDKPNGVAEWLRRGVSKHVGSSRPCPHPTVGTTDRKPTANSALPILPASVNGYSEVTLRTQAVVLQVHISRLTAQIPSLR